MKIYRLTGATFINKNYASLVAVYIGVNESFGLLSSVGTYRTTVYWGQLLGPPICGNWHTGISGNRAFSVFGGTLEEGLQLGVDRLGVEDVKLRF